MFVFLILPTKNYVMFLGADGLKINMKIVKFVSFYLIILFVIVKTWCINLFVVFVVNVISEKLVDLFIFVSKSTKPVLRINLLIAL